jgi:hypothetical protein
MKAVVKVDTRSDKVAIETAMTDPATKAFVIVMGTLLQLPSDRARRRVLIYVHDRLEEQREQHEKAPAIETAFGANGGETLRLT